MSSFAEFAFQQLNRHGDKVFIIDAETGRRMTFHQVLRESRQLTRWLRTRILVGQHVCLCARSKAQYIPAFLAVAAAGGVAVQINPEFTLGELRQTFERVSPVLVFCDTDNYQVVRKAADKRQQIVVFSDIVESGVPDDVSYDSIIRDNNTDEDHPLCQPVVLSERAPLHIIFSSGTTGLPKPVVIPHQARITNAYQLCDPSIRLFETEDVLLLILPLYLMFATIIWSVALLEGATVVIMSRFRPETFLDAMQEHRVTSLPTAPPLVLFLLSCPLVDKFDLSSLRNVICGGAPLPPSLGGELKKKFNLKSCRQGYGMTEAGHLTLPSLPSWTENQGPTSLVKRRVRQEWESIGRPLPGIEMQIRDLGTGRVLVGAHQSGQLCFRGPQCMLGYLNNPQVTRDMIDDDGWLHTGDVGYVDEDGYIFFVDRAKDLIKCKGHQVAPAELEALLLQHPLVSDAAVLGLPDLYAGELPFAFVVLRSGLKDLPSPQDILTFVAERTCRQKHLAGGIRFVDDIPKSPSGKILRRVLRDLLLTETDGLQGV